MRECSLSTHVLLESSGGGAAAVHFAVEHTHHNQLTATAQHKQQLQTTITRKGATETNVTSNTHTATDAQTDIPSKCGHIWRQLRRCIRARKGPAHIARCVADMHTDRRRTATHIVAQCTHHERDDVGELMREQKTLWTGTKTHIHTHTHRQGDRKRVKIDVIETYPSQEQRYLRRMQTKHNVHGAPVQPAPCNRRATRHRPAPMQSVHEHSQPRHRPTHAAGAT